MKTDTCDDTLLVQELALDAYFDALLSGAHIPAEQSTVVRPREKVQVQATIAVPEQTPESVPALDGVPDWAQERFQALLFEVAGVTLAVPLTKLKDVVPNEHGFSEMQGHSSLLLGVTPYQGVQAKVVDTARFVLPADRIAQLSQDVVDRSGQLVVIDEGRWALACSKIGDVVELEPAQVKWRTAAGKRRWLAGTAINRMCALLDIEELTRQLVDGMA